eukprot:1179372-Prorocentrum_minimum.AAC.3
MFAAGRAGSPLADPLPTRRAMLPSRYVVAVYVLRLASEALDWQRRSRDAFPRAIFQGHWRFPGGQEAQGYAYILTHPGTPTVFYDHVFYFPELKEVIVKLMDLRKRQGIHCRSEVSIEKAEKEVYGAVIGDKIAVKLGPGRFEPKGGNWKMAVEGKNFKVWERS